LLPIIDVIAEMRYINPRFTYLLTYLLSTPDFYCFTWITNDFMSTICFYHYCSIGEYTKTKVHISLYILK